jgi:hypothetical protein
MMASFEPGIGFFPTLKTPSTSKNTPGILFLK